MSIQYRAWIQTHDLWNMSLLPLPLDQGSRAELFVLYTFTLLENKFGNSKHQINF